MPLAGPAKTISRRPISKAVEAKRVLDGVPKRLDRARLRAMDARRTTDVKMGDFDNVLGQYWIHDLLRVPTFVNRIRGYLELFRGNLLEVH